MLSNTMQSAPAASQRKTPTSILHVVAGMDPKTGGVCQAIRTIIDGLTGLNIHNEVASVDAPDADYLADSPFPVHALGPAGGPWQYSDRLLPWLVDNMARFDTVIVHGLWLYHSYAAHKAMQRLKRSQPNALRSPVFLVMPHGMLDPWFQKAAGRRIKAVRNWLYWKLIEGDVVNQADGMLFTCQEELLLARTSFRPYHPGREINIGYGIADAPAFVPAMQTAFAAKCPGLTDQPYLLFLSRIDVKKGVDILLKAYADVWAGRRAAGLTMPKLVIAGPGLETDYGQHIRQLATENPDLSPSILWPGMLTGDTKWGAFYGCSAFVLPSHQENFGIAVVEALSCGKPVLISDQVNIWREIESSGGGLVAPDSVAGTRQLLNAWLALSATDQLAMEGQARQAFETHFYLNPAAVRIADAIGTCLVSSDLTP